MPVLAYMVPAGEGNPQWVNPEQTMIDINVFFPHLGETVRYTSAKVDPGWEHSEEIFLRASRGEFGEVAPYGTASIIPPVLTARQLRLGLLRNGITADTIINTINAIPDPIQREEARVEWEYASEYRYDHPLVGIIRERLGRPPEETLAAWISWASI